jgi:formylglycine-generating enzyme required for sulfatase activity
MSFAAGRMPAWFFNGLLSSTAVSDATDSGLARDDFIVLYFADRDRGTLRSDAEYLALFPRHQAVISRELERVRASRPAAPETSEAPDAAPSSSKGARRHWMLDRYRIERELGHGGQGTVFLAFDTKLARRVALKILKPAWSGFAAVVRRFDREARALARLDHPGLAAVHDVASAHGVEYLVMPYVEGRTLAHDRATIARPDRAAILRYVEWIAKSARALHVAHEAGLVHRDIKPANIMVGADGEPVVVDFGLALFRELEPESLTVTGDVLGTAEFMAPEQVAGRRERIDRRTDVFALATTLRSLVSEAGRFAAAVPRDLIAVIEAGSDPDPDRRYASAAELADDLARVRHGLPIAIRPARPWRRLWRHARAAPAAAALVVLPPLALLGGAIGLSLKNDAVRAAALELERQRFEANAAESLAAARFLDHQRLDDLRRLRELEVRAQDLWPPSPEVVPTIERWIADADELLARRSEHRAALESLRGHGQPLANGAGWQFERIEDEWLAEQLAVLGQRLEALAEPDAYGCTRAAALRALDLALTIERTTLVEPAAAWREAIDSIANPATDPAYGGLRIEPILGLVPLGRDPASRLWEFAHVPSGTPPVRDPAGELSFGEDSSIVLVLVPGGRVSLGARTPLDDHEPFRDHVDPMSTLREGPVHEVVLDPHLISKFELTQGQWSRATGSNPSHHHPGSPWRGPDPTLMHPVEQVSFEECFEVLRRLGLEIPTEAQWERAARAGTTTPWWTGDAIDDFLADENLCDRTWAEGEEVALPHDARRNDGWSGPAPVGTYPPNPFGLYDVIGNVSEWCRDRMAFYGQAPALPGDGLRADGLDDARVVRGGAFNVPARNGRSAVRYGLHETSRNGAIGVRPALALPRP